jgi:hypothetical protein
MAAPEIANERLEAMKTRLAELLMEEFKDQGHFMNGAVVKDMEWKTEQKKGTITITGAMAKYAGYLERGTPASKIPYTPGRHSGAGPSKFIEALTSYVKQRIGVRSEAQAKSIAFAIATAQKKHGMPTPGANPGSYGFSNNGKRLAWVSETFNNHQDEILSLITAIARDNTQIVIDVLVAKEKTEFKTASR